MTALHRTLAVAALLAGGCTVQFDGHGAHFSSDGDVTATRIDRLPLAIAAGELLELRGGDGDVKVRAGDGPFELVATWSGSGDDDAEANAILAHGRVEFATALEGTRTKLRTTLVREPNGGGIFGARRPSVSVELHVPRGVALDIATAAGALDVAGPCLDARLATNFGSVTVVDTEGDVTAESSSGELVVRRVRGDLQATTQFGDVTIEEVEGAAIVARTSSGAVKLAQVQAARIEARSSFGDVTLRDCGDGTLLAKSASGAILVERAGRGSFRLESDFGDVTLREASGEAELTTSSGAARARRFEGRLRAKSGFGEIELEGIFLSVAAETSSGSVKVTLDELPDALDQIALRSQYGDVRLLAPDGIAGELDLRTSFGEARCDLPVAGAEIGEEKRSLRGRLGAGGPPIRLESASGDVKVVRHGKAAAGGVEK